jgi:hypothetical protein
MRKADLAKNHDWFEEQIDWYMTFLRRTIGAQDIIKERHDKVEIIEASILRICAFWESFIIEELIDCLNLDCSKFSAHLRLSLPKDMSKDMCAAVLLGDRYLDFKGVSDMKGFANKVLCDENNPFKLIENPMAKKIDEVYVIRNYLSHLSRNSERRLRQMYQNSYNLRNFVRPGDFLLSYRARRLYQYIESFFRSSKQMRGIIT